MKSFKEWVTQHNPELKWDFNNPEKLSSQLNGVIKECGNLELKDIFNMMFINNDSGLTPKQNKKFLIHYALKK